MYPSLLAMPCSLFVAKRGFTRVIAWGCLGLASVATMPSHAAGGDPVALPERPRLLVTTDIGGDPDDIQSMIRLFAHIDLFEIEGLVASSSGTPSELEAPETQPDIIRRVIDAYEPVHDVFRLHTEPTFVPTPMELQGLVYSGSAARGVSSLGPANYSEGSRRIIEAVDASDRPLNVAVWGGATEVAQALHEVQATRTTGELESFVSKLRVVAIGDQDGWSDFNEGTGNWIRNNFPGLRYLDAGLNSSNRFDGLYRGMYQNDSANFAEAAVPLVTDEVAALNQTAWVEQNLHNGHGELGAMYPLVNQNPNTSRNTTGVKEGDRAICSLSTTG